ncbi:hypothetical protein ACFFX1_21510 [Dactylosporangium sucinum]|uniref:hypothetical protein n=1 Tax=Dactylosporangium sucinum TaxID=1424081 RepID=UPI00167F0628|nr:hypothetical protein [Dactylosporangium sucinum]
MIVKLSGVRTAADTPVTLLFVEAGVHVIDHSARRGRLLRLAGGAVFAAFAIAALGLGFGHAVNRDLGAALAAAALILAIAAGVTAFVVWLFALQAERTMRRGESAPDIAVDAVRWANSKPEHGRVEVTVGMADGTIHTFHAVGMAGPELARQFGRLLAVGQESPSESSADTAARPGAR